MIEKKKKKTLYASVMILSEWEGGIDIEVNRNRDKANKLASYKHRTHGVLSAVVVKNNHTTI